MSTRKFDEQELALLVYGDMEGFVVVRSEITDTTRWSVLHTTIVREEASGKLYQINWSKGATEYQDNGPEFNTTDIPEVEACAKTITEYRRLP